MPLNELPAEERTCANCEHGVSRCPSPCCPSPYRMAPCNWWREAPGHLRKRAETKIAELEAERDALSRGQESLRDQTVRIRHALTDVVEEGVDTEDIARRVRRERDEWKIRAELAASSEKRKISDEEMHKLIDVVRVKRERDDACAALGAVLTPQLRAILSETVGPDTFRTGHDPNDIIIVGRIGFRVLKRALDVLTSCSKGE